MPALPAPGAEPVNGPDVVWYLCVAAFLFFTGALGVLIRRSPLIVLLSLEIMLNGANLALIAFACWLFNYYGVNFLFSGKHSYAGV